MNNSMQTKPISSGQDALNDAACQIMDPHLRQFFKAMTQEPEIHLALTMPITETQLHGTGFDRNSAKDCYPIQIIQRAGCAAGLWCAHRPLVHDVLYVATIVQGVRQLIQWTLSSGSYLDYVLFTLIRPALHRLDDRHADAARLLRGVLDLGNDDESQDIGVLQIRHAAVHACQLLHRKGGSKPTTRQFKRSRAKSGQSKFRQANKVRQGLVCGGCDWEKSL